MLTTQDRSRIDSISASAHKHRGKPCCDGARLDIEWLVEKVRELSEPPHTLPGDHPAKPQAALPAVPNSGDDTEIIPQVSMAGEPFGKAKG